MGMRTACLEQVERFRKSNGSSDEVGSLEIASRLRVPPSFGGFFHIEIISNDSYYFPHHVDLGGAEPMGPIWPTLQEKNYG